MSSGDLGPDERTFHAALDADEGFDHVISESTCGGRERADYTLDGRRAALREELVAALSRGGNVVVPCSEETRCASTAMRRTSRPHGRRDRRSSRQGASRNRASKLAADARPQSWSDCSSGRSVAPRALSA